MTDEHQPPLPGQQPLPGMPEGTGQGATGGTHHQDTHTDVKPPVADSIWQQAKRGEVLKHVEEEKTKHYQGHRNSAASAPDPVLKNKLLEEADTIREKIKGPKLEAFAKDLGKGDRIMASVSGNWNHSGGMGKLAMAGGSIVGVGSVISGVKNIISPVKDENGQRKDGLFKQGAKIVGGALLVYLSAIRGGDVKSMGLGR